MRLPLIPLFLLVCSQAFAQSFTARQATRTASAFLSARGKHPTLKAERLPLTVADDRRVVAGKAPSFYMLKPDGGKGFVLVAGDGDSQEVVAYSDESTIDACHLPDAFKLMLESYGKESLESQEAFSSQAVAPLTETTWGQGSPYNQLCLMADGKQAVTGYTATALAQVLYYHRSPSATTAIPAYTTAKGASYEGLESTTMEWEKMRRHYTGSEGEAEKEAVAKLMLYASRAIATNYGSSTSTADIQACTEAINQYFGYENPATVISRDECSNERWQQIIRHELTHGRPVIYMASNSLNSSHAFICDGYDGLGYYHVNWGQDGEANGYYRLHGINPATLTPYKNVTAYGYTMNHSIITGISPQTVDDKAPTPDAPALRASAADLEVVNVEQQFGITTRNIVTATLRNSSTYDYQGMLRLQLDGTYLSTENVYISPGSEEQVSFLFSKAAGTYPLHIIERPSGTVIYASDAFEIAETTESPTPVMKSNEVRNMDNDAMLMYGTLFDASVTLSNPSATDYHGAIKLELFVIQDEGVAFLTTKTKSKTTYISLAAGETQTFDIQYDDNQVGDRFFYAITCDGGTVSGGSSYHPYTIADAYVWWDATGQRRTGALSADLQIPEEATAVSLEDNDIEGTSITPNGNPNTIYYLGYAATCPESLTECNVVVGQKARGDISFVEGHDLFVPAAFLVEGEVRFSYIPVNGGYLTKGWSTLTLPYAVQQITADGAAVNWCKDLTDKDYRCWLRQLTSVCGDTLYFDTANEWLPGVPYLLAVPDSQWGSKYDLRGHTLTLSATNTWVRRTAANPTIASSLEWTGSTTQSDRQQVYVINDEGSAFELKAAATVPPFNGWVKAADGSALASQQLIIATHSDLMGDVNRDGRVNVADVMAIVNYILSRPQDTFLYHLGDFNADGDLSVADVMTTISVILRK